MTAVAVTLDGSTEFKQAQKGLEAVGMEITHAHESFGVIFGDIAESQLAELAGVDGIANIEEREPVEAGSD